MIACVGDVHIGNIAQFGGRRNGSINRRCQWSLAAMDRAVEVANNNEVPFVVLGDLFDTSRPEPAVITAVQQSLARAKHGAHVLVGNHDLHSTTAGDNACSPLAPVAKIYEEPTIVSLSDDLDGMMVPFQPGKATEWLPELVYKIGPTVGGKPKVMCLHLGISDGDTPYYLDGHDDTIPAAMLQEICTKWNIAHVVAGNWHWHQQWRLHNGGHMVQVGTLAPVRHTDDGFEGRGGVTMLGEDSLSYIEVPGPRFFTANSIEEMREAMTHDGSPLFLRVRLPIEQHQEAYDLHHEMYCYETELACELEVVEIATKARLDKSELGEKIERLSELPVDAAIFEVAGEIAAELELDANRLNETVSACMRGEV